MTQRNVFELRAAVSLSALEAITTHLGGLREGRKSVLFVSQGPPVGMPGSPNYPRLEAALQAANRGNVTVHVLDPRPAGFALRSAGPKRCGGCRSRPAAEPLSTPTIPRAALKQVMADASAYYLIGYSPTRPRLDGKFHKINVRVKRSGVRVTARRGYWAPTEAESNPAPVKPADPKLTGALSELVTRTGDGRLIDVWVGTEPGEDGHSAVHVTWELARRSVDSSPAVVEFEPVTRTGTTLGEAQSIRTPPREGDAPTVASYQLKPGPLALRVTVRSAGGCGPRSLDAVAGGAGLHRRVRSSWGRRASSGRARSPRPGPSTPIPIPRPRPRAASGGPTVSSSTCRTRPRAVSPRSRRS